jgi:tetratricopeptide (TPR) repeat protein
MKRRLLSMLICIFMSMVMAGCSTAGSYYNNGKKSYENGNYEEAAVNFSKAIKANPNRADYYIGYAVALVELEKYEEALAQFDLAFSDKNMLLIRENNKRVYRGKGITYYRMQQYDKAAKEFKKALSINELSELDMDILYYMGQALCAEGSYQEAAKIYSSMISKNKKNAKAYGNRALCYRYLGEYKKSLSDYDNAISLQPDHYDNYFGKYFLLKDNNDTEGAAKVLAQAEEIKDDTTEGEYNKAKIHFYQEDYETALSMLNKGFQDGFQEAYYYIGEIYRDKKDYTKAIYYYENYINSGEVKLPNVYNQIALCLIKTGESERAVEYLDEGIACHQTETLRTLEKNKIIAYENLGMFDEAKQQIEDYLVSYPEDIEALRELDFIKTRLISSEKEDNIAEDSPE